jgi:hypothetical protein
MCVKNCGDALSCTAAKIKRVQNPKYWIQKQVISREFFSLKPDLSLIDKDKFNTLVACVLLRILGASFMNSTRTVREIRIFQPGHSKKTLLAKESNIRKMVLSSPQIQLKHVLHPSLSVAAKRCYRSKPNTWHQAHFPVSLYYIGNILVHRKIYSTYTYL